MSSADDYEYKAVSAFEISDQPQRHRMEKGQKYRQFLAAIVGKYH